MKERIIDFLRAENKSSSQFAEEIGVQPSGISHILSGRNNPSLDFVMKMLERYKYLSTEWLLFGKGSMYRDNSGMPTLFDQDFAEKPAESSRIMNPETVRSSAEVRETAGEMPDSDDKSDKTVRKEKKISSVEKIVWFFSDGSFEEYFPR